MNLEKQSLLVGYVISSKTVFSLCSNILKSEYFDPELRATMSFILDYHNKYGNVPNRDQVIAECDYELKTGTITTDVVGWCADEIEAFCRRKAIERAVLDSVEYIENGEYNAVEELVKTALMVSLNKDVGMDYFWDTKARLERLSVSEKPVSTGYTGMDDVLNGGILRKQLLLLSANSGGGKSLMMNNIGLNMCATGLNVLTITLELSEEMISLRQDSMLSGVGSRNWRDNKDKIIDTLEALKSSYGKMFIKYLPSGSNTNDFRSLLVDMKIKHGFMPDVVCVDYLDMMHPNVMVAGENSFDKDKRSTEELRNLANEFNFMGISASQQNRGAVGVNTKDLNHSHIAGGLSKVNTTDVLCSIIMTEEMKAEGKIGIHFLKTRSSDGVGKTIFLDFCPISLRITNPEETTSGSSKLRNAMAGRKINRMNKPETDGLLDIMSEF